MKKCIIIFGRNFCPMSCSPHRFTKNKFWIVIKVFNQIECMGSFAIVFSSRQFKWLKKSWKFEIGFFVKTWGEQLHCSVVVMLCYVWRVHILKYRGRADRMHQCYTHKMAGFFTQNVMLSQMFFHIFFFDGKRNGFIYQFLLNFSIQITCIKGFIKVLFENLMGKL